MSISGGVLGALSEGSGTPSAVSVSSSSDSLSDHGGLAGVGNTWAGSDTSSSPGEVGSGRVTGGDMRGGDTSERSESVSPLGR